MAVAAITRQATCASSLARLRVSVQVTRSEVRALSLSCRRLVERPGQSPDLGGGLRSHDAELGQVTPQCIDDLRALAWRTSTSRVRKSIARACCPSV